MRNIILFILPVYLLSCKQEKESGYEISGTLKNASGKMIYLQETPLASGQRIIVDSSVVDKDGGYKLKGKAAEEVMLHLIAKDEIYPFAFVINDASKIKVDADLNEINQYTVTGSPASIATQQFSTKAAALWKQLNALGTEFDSLRNANASDSIMQGINSRGQKLIEEMKNFVINFIEKSPSPIASIAALSSYPQTLSPTEYERLFAGIVSRFPKHQGAAAAKQMDERQKALSEQRSGEPSSPEWIGKQAPELTMPDVNGKEVKLSSFKGKYVLVDFWASWCKPCRLENPNVVSAYNKHKNKSFTILGVSLDQDKDDWVKAIEKDGLTWTHISDLQYWSSAAVPIYKFQSIPFNVLLDPEGKIIAQDLRGSELDAKLSEVLK